MYPAFRMTLRSTLAILLVFAALPTLAEQVYRWVDDKGQVHFGAMPPHEKERQAQAYELRVTPPSSTPLPEKKTDKPASPEESKDTELKGSVSAEDAKKYCDEGRNYKATLSEDFSRRYTQPDGTVRPLTDAERAAEVKKADDIVKRYCGK